MSDNILKSRPIVIFHKDQLLNPSGVNGGAETATLSLAKALKKQNQKVFLAAQLPKEFLSSLASNAGQSGDGLLYIDLDETFDTTKAFRTIETTYHLESFDLIAVSRVQALFESRHNSKIKKRIFLTHEPATGAFGANLFAISRVADKIVAVSEAQKQTLVEAGAPEENVIVIPNGVDLEIFKPGKPEQQKPWQIVFAGALVVDKGLHLLLEAFVTLKQKYPQLTLDVYGSASMWGRKDYFNISEVAKIPAINFHGAVAQEKLAEAFQGAALVVLPSIYFDSFNLACAEAQACGTPVIGSYHTGMRDIIEDQTTGILLKEVSVASISQAIDKLLSDSNRLNEMRQAALQKVRPKFSWDKSAEKFRMLLTTQLPALT